MIPKLTIFLLILAVCAAASVLLPIEILVRTAAFCVLVFICTKVLSAFEAGRYVLSVIRGTAWGVRLGEFPKKFRADRNVRITAPKYVMVGCSCNIGEGAVLAPLGKYKGKVYPSRIKIGDRVHIGAFSRIAAMQEVVIGDDALISAFVHITDHSHEYRNVDLPVSGQGVYSKGSVHIGQGAWLAFGCQILSGVTVGEHSVVAANAVVTKDIPPYCVAAGNPAKVISRYDFDAQKWVRTVNDTEQTQ